MKILIVGNRGGTNVGGSFERGAVALGIEVHLLEMREATEGPLWAKRWSWWVRGKRPLRLASFSRKVVETCRQERPDYLIVTGMSPVDAASLAEIGRTGVGRLNYLTDDPWNPAHRSQWFFRALPHYDCIFSTRRANFDDLTRAGCLRIEYLPFAYDPELCFPEPGAAPDDDVVFAGGADRERVPYIAAILHAGFRLGLYGSYWDRYSETRGHSQGQADPATVRRVISAGKVALGLVRRANRDGHAMRTFEVPAMQGCMVVEDTGEHREIFGNEGKNVLYFNTMPEMIAKIRWLLDHPEDRLRLAAAAHGHIVQGGNTYKDRLAQMLEHAHR